MYDFGKKFDDFADKMDRAIQKVQLDCDEKFVLKAPP